jgi:hypothetical protein
LPAAVKAEDAVYPSVRGAPSAPLDARVQRPVEQTVGPPTAPGRPDPTPRQGAIPDRAPVRGEAGTAEGTVDPTRSHRGIARSPAGEAVGTVEPSRSGGGVVRAPDGSVEGFVPSRPSRRGMGESPR